MASILYSLYSKGVVKSLEQKEPSPLDESVSYG